jgi:hypothetical protein
MAVFKILAETENGIPPEANAGRYLDFVPFLSALATRFPAAKLLADMMDETTNDIVERSKTMGVAWKDPPPKTPGPPSVKTPEANDRPKDVEEAEILNCVAKMVDLRLSTDVSKT